MTLSPDADNVKINAKSTANDDNIFALFSRPNQKILDQFKNNFYPYINRDETISIQPINFKKYCRFEVEEILKKLALQLNEKI